MAKQLKNKKEIPAIDFSTEEKIKNAARTIFHQKGFAATRTRDIAVESGINLALLNYYFRSKEKLFGIIMQESMAGFVQTVRNAFNNETTSLERKIELFVSNYIDLLIEQPDLPLFLLSELRSRPDELIARINIKSVLQESHFMRQFQQEIKAGKITPVNPLHFMMNVMGLTVFPFVGSPMLKHLGGLSQQEFNELMLERKKLIPKWVKAMLKTK